MRGALNRFWRDTTGQNAIEYGMISALIVILLIASIGSMGSSVDGMFESIADAFEVEVEE